MPSICTPPEMQEANVALSRCLGVAATVEELLGFIEGKQSNLRDTDILIKQTDKPERAISGDYWWIIEQTNGFWAIFEEDNGTRKFLGEFGSFESLLAQYHQKNCIISF